MEKEGAAKECDQDPIFGERENGGSLRAFMVIMSSSRQVEVDVITLDGKGGHDSWKHQQCNCEEDGAISKEPAGCRDNRRGKEISPSVEALIAPELAIE